MLIYKPGIFAKTTSEGEVAYLKDKHFDKKGKLSSVFHHDLNIDYVTKKHLLSSGDVLFAAKGRKNFASCYESNGLPAVASTSFFVIKINEDSIQKILPSYLTWFINHPLTQKFLKDKAKGRAIPLPEPFQKI